MRKRSHMYKKEHFSYEESKDFYGEDAKGRLHTVKYGSRPNIYQLLGGIQWTPGNGETTKLSPLIHDGQPAS